jgi:two-component system phosphate regulon response regulator PhoB
VVIVFKFLNIDKAIRFLFQPLLNNLYIRNYRLTDYILKKNIYLVEDNEAIREMVVYLLESENFKVSSFENATRFKSQILIELPDLVILDVMLPDGNGIEVGNELKSKPSTQHIPVLLMSANANMVKDGKESLADDFINKPFDINDLLKRVERLLKI